MADGKIKQLRELGTVPFILACFAQSDEQETNIWIFCQTTSSRSSTLTSEDAQGAGSIKESPQFHPAIRYWAMKGHVHGLQRFAWRTWIFAIVLGTCEVIALQLPIDTGKPHPWYAN